ncbi:MAG: phage baseplate protein [Clostridia bacterium]
MACKGGTFQSGEDKYYPNAYYEIGDLFLTTNSENPSIRFGGTWELFGKGKTLVCVDDSDSDFSAVKKTGGEKTHTLTGEEMPSHSHTLFSNSKSYSSTGSGYWHLPSAVEGYSSGNKVQIYNYNSGTNNYGGNEPHNNLQPYITCYIWIRIK